MTMLKFPHVDTEAMLDVVRDLSRDLDTSRLVALRDDLGKLELPHTDDLRREFDKLDLRDISKLDLPHLNKLLGRPARKAAWALPVVTPAVVLGAVMLVAGAALGGMLAWLYQPDAGVQRRKAVRRRLRKMQRMIQHSR
jgi:hypothetical protein